MPAACTTKRRRALIAAGGDHGLGGNHGSHFYAWWAPKNALPLKESGEFSEVADGAVFLRDIRHHDDHSPLQPQSFDAHYMPVTVRDLRREEYAPLPWTQPQARFASARQPVRLLKGHPGSGKTTALWHAADSTGAERILYVTYSRDLAALARDYFDRFCSSHKRFHCRHVSKSGATGTCGWRRQSSLEHDTRQRFGRDLAPFARISGRLGQQPRRPLRRIPRASGRRCASSRHWSFRLPANTHACPTRHTGSAARDPWAKQRLHVALEAAARLERLDSSTLAERYFPELALAWRAVETAACLRPTECDPALT